MSEAAAERVREQRHDAAHEERQESAEAAEPAEAKREADGDAGDAAARRIAGVGGWAEAGEKVGDKGVLTVDVKVGKNKQITIPKGTRGVITEVRGEELIVQCGGFTAKMPSSSFLVDGRRPAPGPTPAPTPAPVKPPEPVKPPDPLKDPKNNPDPKNEYAQSAEYGEVKGVVAVKGEGDAHEIAANDVQQGSIGDCYFVAQLAAQAKANPGVIKNLIKDNGDGTFTVTLHLRDKTRRWGPRQKTDIVVDSQFPKNNGSVAYAKPGDSGAQGPELWVMLIEKAFAKYTGSFETIRGSKTPDGDVFAMMSGVESASYTPAMLGADALLDKCGKAVAAGKAVSFGAKSKNTADEKLQQEAKDAGVVLNHAYALEAVDGKAKTLSLRNPWGVKHLMDFPVDKVLKFYDSVDIAAK